MQEHGGTGESVSVGARVSVGVIVSTHVSASASVCVRVCVTCSSARVRSRRWMLVSGYFLGLCEGQCESE